MLSETGVLCILNLLLSLIFFTYFIFRAIFFKLFLLLFDTIISFFLPLLEPPFTFPCFFSNSWSLFPSFSYIYIAIYLYFPQTSYAACMYGKHIGVLFPECDFLYKAKAFKVFLSTLSCLWLLSLYNSCLGSHLVKTLWVSLCHH